MLRGSFVRFPSDVVGGPEKLRRESVINQERSEKGHKYTEGAFTGADKRSAYGKGAFVIIPFSAESV